MLREGSAISEEVIAERGYYTATSAIELRRLGFSEAQSRTPALVIPVYNVHGEPDGYQIRPDQPREANGHVVKYEVPKGSALHLDVPRRFRASLADPSVDLYVTEGIKK